MKKNKKSNIDDINRSIDSIKKELKSEDKDDELSLDEI